MQATPMPANANATASEPGALWWKIDRDAGLKVRHWGEDVVVFNPRSGHTHFLDEVSGRLLQWLAEQPRTEDELVRLMAAELGLPADAEVQAPLHMWLRQLDELGLIDRTAPCA